jgi:hypothetical protein
MAYWAPAMGAKNIGDKDSSKQALDRFNHIMKKISAKTDNKIFIEQFLFDDNTPGMNSNTAIDPNEISRFLEGVAGALLRHTSGYALWGKSDYDASMVFNGFFSLGTMGWKFQQGAAVVAAGDDYVARLRRGASITQPIPAKRDNYHLFAKSIALRFLAAGPGDISVAYAGATRKVHVNSRPQFVKLDFPVGTEDSDLSFTSEAGTISLTNIQLFSFTQVSHVRDSLGNPRRYLPDIRKLNKLIEAGRGLPSKLKADDKTISDAVGVYEPEQDGARWYAWSGPEVQARMLVKAPAITIQGNIRPTLFRQPGGCMITVSLDGLKVADKLYTEDAPINLSVSVPSALVGKPADLRISSSCSINLKKQQLGNDDRTLSFMLNEISALPKK